jgi:RNA polymerase sigma-B factor
MRQRLDHDDAFAHLEPLFGEMARLHEGHPRRGEARELLITGYLPVAATISRRYSGKGVALEDLRQVASLGLIHAVDRYDPARETGFVAFAVPTIKGEIRRHFRDATWPVHVPRRLQELRLAINQASEDLTHELARPATRAELAERLEVPAAELELGLEACRAYWPESLDTPVTVDRDAVPLAESIGGEDAALDMVDAHETLVRLIDDLTDRERRILALRFFEDLTQAQIAHAVGVSQMHVSRLLKQLLETLRQGMLAVPALPLSALHRPSRDRQALAMRAPCLPESERGTPKPRKPAPEVPIEPTAGSDRRRRRRARRRRSLARSRASARRPRTAVVPGRLRDRRSPGPPIVPSLRSRRPRLTPTRVADPAAGSPQPDRRSKERGSGCGFETPSS